MLNYANDKYMIWYDIAYHIVYSILGLPSGPKKTGQIWYLSRTYQEIESFLGQ